jgi:hypothetical protein
MKEDKENIIGTGIGVCMSDIILDIDMEMNMKLVSFGGVNKKQ